jgi:hypothetical protein
MNYKEGMLLPETQSSLQETKNKIQFNTSSLFYRGHTLPDAIALEYPNVENPVD